jgi:DNA-binding beta-propeller fold protein YncE
MAVVVGSDPFVYDVVDGWEQLPDGWDHLDVPSVAIGADDRVFVFTRAAHPVIVYSSDGTFERSFGEGDFVVPHGITVVDGRVYCVDKGDHCVRIYTTEGQTAGMIGTPGLASDTGIVDDFRSIARGGPPFNQPTALAVAPDGNLYVADGYGNARIHVFTPSGGLLFSWGEPGTGPGEFNIPHAIAVANDGRVLVADRENDRIQVFEPDGSYVTQWTNVCRPDDLTIGPDGLVYVVELGLYVGRWPSTPPDTPDSPPSRLSIFDLDGNVLARWGDRESCAPGSFFAPHGIAVDSSGAIYVTEANWSGGGKDGEVPHDCHTLQKFVRR